MTTPLRGPPRSAVRGQSLLDRHLRLHQADNGLGWKGTCCTQGIWLQVSQRRSSNKGDYQDSNSTAKQRQTHTLIHNIQPKFVTYSNSKPRQIHHGATQTVKTLTVPALSRYQLPNPDASRYSSHTKPAHYSRHSRRFPTNTTVPHLIKMGRRTGVVGASMSSGRAQNTKLVRHNEATRHVQRARGRRRLWSQPAHTLPERNTG